MMMSIIQLFESYPKTAIVTSVRAGEVKISWSWIPILGKAIEFGERPFELILEHARVAKDIFGLLIAGDRMFFISDPTMYNAVFRCDKTKLDFEAFADKVMVNVFGASSAMVHEGPMNPHLIGFNDMARQQYNKFLFQDSELDPLTGLMQAKMHEMVMNISGGVQTVDMKDFVFTFAYRASVAALFNSELADNVEVQKSFDDFDHVFAMVLGGVPLSVFPSSSRGRKIVKDALLETYARASGPFMTARRSMFDRFSFGSAEVSTSNLAIMWAAVGNTMPAAYWTLYFILSHKDALVAVEKEVFSIFGHDTAAEKHRAITGNDLVNLKVLDSCVSEALRLMSGSMTVRKVVCDGFELSTSLGNTYKFRKGDTIALFPGITHYDESIFPEPCQFKFDRFIDPPLSFAKNGQNIPFNCCFMPFGGGTSWCPGRKFARNEIKMIVAFLISTFEFSFQDSTQDYSKWKFDTRRVGLGVFPPHGGIKLTFKKRIC